MISVTVEGATLGDVQAQLQQMFGGVAAAQAPTADVPRRPGRPPKSETKEATPPAQAQVVDPFATDAPPAPAAPAEPVKKYSVEDVRAVLKELAKQRPSDADSMVGMGRVTALLGKMGYTKISEIPDTQYTLFVEEAKAQIEKLGPATK